MLREMGCQKGVGFAGQLSVLPDFTVLKTTVGNSFFITGSPWSFLSEACSFVLEEGNPLCRGYFLATRAEGE